MRNVACLVHIRRKFAEIVKLAGGDAKAEGAGSVALAARRRIDAMFAADSGFDEMAAAGEWERRRLGRERDLRPLMEDFFIWAQARRMEATPRMALDKALEYAVKHWPYAMDALDDGRLPLDSNLPERGIKPFVIERKNFLFSDTPRGVHGRLPACTRSWSRPRRTAWTRANTRSGCSRRCPTPPTRATRPTSTR